MKIKLFGKELLSPTKKTSRKITADVTQYSWHSRRLGTSGRYLVPGMMRCYFWTSYKMKRVIITTKKSAIVDDRTLYSQNTRIVIVEHPTQEDVLTRLKNL